ncbi:FFLEELY motif protein [Limnobacter sp.]
MIDIHSSPLELQKAIAALRRGEGRSVDFLRLKTDLKIFQNNRLEFTYKDLLEDKGMHAACRFFLDQLYCTHDVSTRDHQVERVLPKLEKLLPSGAVDTVRKVIYMDYLAELLDDEITSYINEKEFYSDNKLKEKSYIEAFRQQGQFDLRERQILLVREVGESLRKLMRLPFLRSLMKMTRGAAQKANLEDFHDFLSQGLDAFASLEKPTLFFQLIQEREMSILEGIRQGTLSKFP